MSVANKTQEDESVEWFTLQSWTEHDPPDWARTLGVSDTGQVFMPAAGLGTERDIVIKALKDAQPLAEFKAHFFVRTDWALQAVPSMADAIRLVVTRAHRMRSYARPGRDQVRYV